MPSYIWTLLYFVRFISCIFSMSDLRYPHPIHFSQT